MKLAKGLLLLLICCAPLAAQTNYTLADVAKHNTPTDCWMIFNKTQVYNLTMFLSQNLHPAGPGLITPLCGADGTAAFNGVSHSGTAQALEAKYLIGNLVTSAISVTISPATAALNTGQTQQFTATTTNSTQGVTWSAASAGTVDTNGVFTAVSPGTGTVTATSVEDKTKLASATVKVTAPTPPGGTPPPPSSGGIAVTVNPTNAMVFVGAGQKFTAKVTGSPNGVHWTATGAVGSIDASGMFTASAAGTGVVKATSVDDSTKSASATITTTNSSSCSVAANATGFVVNCAPANMIPGNRYDCRVTPATNGKSEVVRCTARRTTADGGTRSNGDD
jgi:hypothetical protein